MHGHKKETIDILVLADTFYPFDEGLFVKPHCCEPGVACSKRAEVAVGVTRRALDADLGTCTAASVPAAEGWAASGLHGGGEARESIIHRFQSSS